MARWELAEVLCAFVTPESLPYSVRENSYCCFAGPVKERALYFHSERCSWGGISSESPRSNYFLMSAENTRTNLWGFFEKDCETHSGKLFIDLIWFISAKSST